MRLYFLAGTVAAALVLAGVGAACSSFDDAPIATNGSEAGLDDGGSVDASQGANDGGAPDGNAMTAEKYRAAVLASLPLAYWRMGTIANVDEVPSETQPSNPLRLFGSFTSGVPGVFAGDQAILFDGTSAFATATTSTPFTFPAKAPFTLELWARHDGKVGTTFEHLIAFIEGPGGTESQNGYLFYIANLDPPKVAAMLDSPDAAAIQAEFAEAAVGAWAHYVYVYDGARILLYIDGQLRATKPTQAVLGLRSTVAFTVATGSNDDKRFFHGAIDEVAVYSTALAPAVIAEHHLIGRGN